VFIHKIRNQKQIGNDLSDHERLNHELTGTLLKEVKDIHKYSQLLDEATCL